MTFEEMGFGGTLLWFTVLFLFLVAVAVAGVMLGKTLRARKDAKTAALSNTENEITEKTQTNS